MNKPILCLDFDGVIHSYSSGWQGASVIPDPPVPEALQFILEATTAFRVAIFSSRSNQPGGIKAMKAWLKEHFQALAKDADMTLDTTARLFNLVDEELEFPTEKPPAFITIDDRALTFDGTWPDLTTLLAFKPWNKRQALGIEG